MTTSAQITKETADTVARFNDAFQRRDKAALAAVVHEDCLMVSAQPAPDGTALWARTRAWRSGRS